MPRFIQVFKSPENQLEVCISDCNLTVWHEQRRAEEIALTLEQSQHYFLAMRSGTFDYSLLNKEKK